MSKNQIRYHKVLREAWELILSDYQNGNIIIKSERDLEKALANSCKYLFQKQNIPLKIGRQENYRNKRVDIRLGSTSDPILVELKLYHDKADWKESQSMINTVESDLKFAKGYDNTYVAIIDVIPSSQRVHLEFSLDWKELEIDKKIFDLYYVGINPPTSPPRERIQKTILANGTEI